MGDLWDVRHARLASNPSADAVGSLFCPGAQSVLGFRELAREVHLVTKPPKRPRDFSQAGKLVVDIATGHAEDPAPKSVLPFLPPTRTPSTERISTLY